MSYNDGSFGIDDLYVVSVFPGKVKDDDHIGNIFIFIQYGYAYINTRKIYLYSGCVMNAIYNSINKNYTSMIELYKTYIIVRIRISLIKLLALLYLQEWWNGRHARLRI